MQVADRFHLMKNMTEAVERFLHREQRFLRPAAELVAAESAPPVVVPAEEKPAADQVTLTRAEMSRERRFARYLEVREMRRQGATIKGIAEHFKMHRRSVQLFLRSDTFPERVRPQMRSRGIDRFVPYLKQRWDAGCHNAAELWREIRAQGFRGGSSAVRQYIAWWRALLPSALRRRRRNEAQNYPVPLVVPSPRRATWLLLRETKELEKEQLEFVERFFDLCPEAQTVQTLARGFNEIVRSRQAGQLESWLAAAITSQIPEMKSFVMGVERDKEAVEAALMYEWSQGQTEGQINRLKMIKRGMFGRAKLDLLKARVVKAA